MSIKRGAANPYRWYEQEMRAPDGSYIRRLQDAPKKELKRASEQASEVVVWELLFEREMFGTMYGMPAPPVE